MQPVKIVSYNIHKGMSPLNRQSIITPMASSLRALAPDILCLQEVQGQHLKRAFHLTDYADAQHAWFAEYLALDSSYGKNAEYAHGHHGNAVLSRHPLDPKHNVNVTVSRLEQRGVLHCEVHPEGWQVPITVLCAHLNLLHHDRKKQYRLISDYVLDVLDKDAPLILAGDFNDWRKQSDAALSRLGLVEAHRALHGRLPATFPARLPVLSLDRLYIKNLRLHEARVHSAMPWAKLSDHLPISATVSPLDFL